MEDYLKNNHDDDISNILNNQNLNNQVQFIYLDLTILQRENNQLYQAILKNPYGEMTKWDEALLNVQKLLKTGNIFLDADAFVKQNCRTRFINLPNFNIEFPNIKEDIGKFVQVKGNVVRMSQSKLLEAKREYICNKCGCSVFVSAEYKQMFAIENPGKCSKFQCFGVPKQKQAQIEYWKDCQELRIQELVSKCVPNTLVVILEDDLVESCQTGDCVTICGTFELRWNPVDENSNMHTIASIRALSIIREESKSSIGKHFSDQLICGTAEWQELLDAYGVLGTRDFIIKSLCPEIYGMDLLKLAIALALASNIEYTSRNRDSFRNQMHVLFVGEPGLGKSKLLKCASEIALKSVLTTGVGCSAAGLTAAAVKEDGKWQLESGALVAADCGVCCIDEFNVMREIDKLSIHEAMEQQTLSIAKAGIVCKLNTRNVIIAAANPRTKVINATDTENGYSSLNIGLGSPLITRFDLIFIIKDEYNYDFDIDVVNHVLNYQKQSVDNNRNVTEPKWNLQKLQTHFYSIRNLDPQISSEANNLLCAFYNFCRDDIERFSSRTSARLLNTLIRMGKAHARLLFSTEVDIIDAITVICLIESSFGFGRLLNQTSVSLEQLPFGLNLQQIKEIYNVLNLRFNEHSVADIELKLGCGRRSVKRSKQTDISSKFFKDSSNQRIMVNNSVEPSRNIEDDPYTSINETINQNPREQMNSDNDTGFCSLQLDQLQNQKNNMATNRRTLSQIPGRMSSLHNDLSWMDDIGI